MTEFYPKSFGSIQFLSRITSLFYSQVELFDQLLERPLSDANSHITPLLIAIRDNCKTMLLLEKAELLNELALIQRIFLQRIINCCYLLNTEKDEILRYLSNPVTSTYKPLPNESEDAFIDFSKNFELNNNSSILSLNLREQVDLIEQKTGVSKDVFMVAMASIFPKSSEILTDSLFGVSFHLGIFDVNKQSKEDKGNIASKNKHEFCAALFFGFGLLDTLFKVLAKRESIEVISKKSADNLAAAKELMKSQPDATSSILTPIDGIWERLSKAEFVAEEKLLKQLSHFESAFKDTYEAGVIVPTLRANRRALLDVKIAALFLKRVLNDLRGVWVLLIRGYTSQAASIAASLYESALATICLTLNQKNIDIFKSNVHKKIPWRIKEMAKMVVLNEGLSEKSREFENSWRSLYAHYVWLCQIKHSSHDSVIHDTVASSIAQNTYVVMAIPNLQKEDLSVKATIAIITLHRSLESIQAFAKVLGYNNDKLPNDSKFDERFKRAQNSAWQAFKPFLKTDLPISIAHSVFVKNHHSIK